MKVSLVQMDMKLADPIYNFKHAEELIRKAAKEDPDVISLPETWNVGFFPRENLNGLSDKNGENVRSVFGALAKELGINIIAGSVANMKNEKVYNTSLVFNRNGECVAEYDKTHLFTPMNEDDFFEFGSNTVTFELDGVRCGLIICYDLRFVELVRTLSLKGIDILFVPAQWPNTRINHWNILNQARAIENQMFVACTNSCGKAGNTQYGGNSMLIDPWGKIVIGAGENEEIITGELDLNILSDIRSSINVFKDRKPLIYKVN
jgi:predicted amidohydrolase